MLGNKQSALGRRAMALVLLGLAGRLSLFVIPGDGNLLGGEFSVGKVVFGCILLLSVLVGVLLAVVTLFKSNVPFIQGIVSPEARSALIAGILGISYLGFWSTQLYRSVRALKKDELPTQVATGVKDSKSQNLSPNAEPLMPDHGTLRALPQERDHLLPESNFSTPDSVDKDPPLDLDTLPETEPEKVLVPNVNLPKAPTPPAGPKAEY